MEGEGLRDEVRVQVEQVVDRARRHEEDFRRRPERLDAAGRVRISGASLVATRAWRAARAAIRFGTFDHRARGRGAARVRLARASADEAR